MKQHPSTSQKIFDELFNTVEVLGVDGTIKSLQSARSKNLILKDMDVEFILGSVSEITCVSREMILNGSSRNDERKIALAACVYFFKKEFYYSLTDIKKIINKDTAQLSRYNAMVENLPVKPKTEFDKNLDAVIKKMKLLITEKKLKSNG